MKKVYITSTSCLSSVGADKQLTWQGIQEGRSGIKKVKQLGFIEDIYAGQIEDTSIEVQWSKLNISGVYTRLEKMLILALKPIVDQKKPSAKSQLILATTKGNISDLAHTGATGADINVMIQRIADLFGFSTLPIVVCNACVSGILAVSVGKRMIQMGECEDAYILAGDELTPFVVSGFNSFQAMSDEPCRPFDINRKGVTLGEATAAIHLSSEHKEHTVAFEVIGEASIADANHISGPSRTGEGLYLSIQGALREAGITAEQVDLVSAHGTATNYNDEMESIAFDRCALATTPIHSLKGYFGHTLGAAGLLELVMVIESMLHNQLVVSRGYEVSGVSRVLNMITTKSTLPLNIALKTASGFGGSNTALLIAKRN
ncbi:beta-ketoacyl synthase N-terminal-like domain-containing protein [Myroides sp. ZB35]|uniref:beta-ketoacyl synthase N-terminal-like domain-containing protein n=1 Tax=Myroides sp. ZB35 TaxID=1458492 RepID=UPI0008F47390|nr:beta-ketoacyl synthase N-terminal-like domain-containing protein [Myroides sp. ZB35]APA91652.1 beta-ketoacyl synthase [Myroides sp. ZB35]